MQAKSIVRAARRAGRAVERKAGIERDWLRSRRGRADLALFHEFSPPPSGGGHQFLRALTRELEGRGLVVEQQRISTGTPAYLLEDAVYALSGSDCTAIKALVTEVDAYNNSGDPIRLPPGFDPGPAKPKQAKSIADDPTSPSGEKCSSGETL